MRDGLTKTEQVVELVCEYLELVAVKDMYPKATKETMEKDAENAIIKAMKIARKFKHWAKKENKEIVQLGAEIKEHREFYIQLGKDIDLEFSKAVSVMICEFGAK